MKLDLTVTNEQYQNELRSEVHKITWSLAESVSKMIDAELHTAIPKSFKLAETKPTYYVASLFNCCAKYVNYEIDFDEALPGGLDAIDEFFFKAFLTLPKSEQLLFYAQYATEEGQYDDYNAFFHFQIDMAVNDWVHNFLTSEDVDFDKWFNENADYFESFIKQYLKPRK